MPIDLEDCVLPPPPFFHSDNLKSVGWCLAYKLRCSSWLANDKHPPVEIISSNQKYLANSFHFSFYSMHINIRTRWNYTNVKAISFHNKINCQEKDNNRNTHNEGEWKGETKTKRAISSL